MGGWFGGGNPSPYLELGTDPSAVADVGFVYTNDVSSTTELMYKDSAGTETQITTAGAVKVSTGSYPLLAPDGTAAAPSWAWSSDTTFGWSRPGNGIALLSRTTNATILRVANSITDASNGEWFAIDWQTAANTCILQTNANGTGTARALDIRLSGLTSSAIVIPPLALATAGSRIRFYNGANLSAASGTDYGLINSATHTVSASCTVVSAEFGFTPTFNYSNGTRTGANRIIYLAPVNTSLQTGNNAAIALSATASALGGVVYFNQTDEVTDYELVYEKFASDIFTIGSVKGGSGTLRGLSFGIAGNAITFYGGTPVTQGASVADASGGAVIDAEARTAINALISRIEALNLIATV